ncbi:MAG: NUDIX domain-containing protein [Clostridia bacterium]|nr:NUDIX domain-containing protein [Clostridia bacterium]
MIEVRFYDTVEDSLLRFAVIIAKSDNRWVLCKHRDRDTLEIPGGHREPGEAILDTAKRELYEETGALRYTLEPICVYSVLDSETPDIQESFGLLCCADITSFEKELHSEIERIVLSDHLPTAWTYPLIQPKLIEEATRRGSL